MNLYLTADNGSEWNVKFDSHLDIKYATVNNKDVRLTPQRERIIYNAFADQFDLDMELRLHKLDRYANH